MEHHITHSSEHALHQTIAHLEARLADVERHAECAYEEALARSYRELLVRYGRRLFLLQSRRFLLSEPSPLIAQGKTD